MHQELYVNAFEAWMQISHLSSAAGALSVEFVASKGEEK